MNNNNNNEFSLHDYLHTLGKRIFIIIESVILIVFFVMLFSYYQTPVYEAKGRIMIEKDDFTMTDDSRRVYRYDDSLMNYIEILKSTVVTRQLENQTKEFFAKILSMSDYTEFKNLYLVYLPQNYNFILSIYSDQEKLNDFFKEEFHKIRSKLTNDDIKNVSNYEIIVNPVMGTEILDVSVKYNNPVLCEYISNQLFEIFLKRYRKAKMKNLLKKFNLLIIR